MSVGFPANEIPKQVGLHVNFIVSGEKALKVNQNMYHFDHL